MSFNPVFKMLFYCQNSERQVFADAHCIYSGSCHESKMHLLQ